MFGRIALHRHLCYYVIKLPMISALTWSRYSFSFDVIPCEERKNGNYLLRIRWIWSFEQNNVNWPHGFRRIHRNSVWSSSWVDTKQIFNNQCMIFRVVQSESIIKECCWLGRLSRTPFSVGFCISLITYGVKDIWGSVRVKTRKGSEAKHEHEWFQRNFANFFRPTLSAY